MCLCVFVCVRVSVPVFLVSSYCVCLVCERIYVYVLIVVSVYAYCVIIVCVFE